MMLNLEKLPPDLIDALRERGRSDERIRKMTPTEAVAEWCGWHIGDPSWGPSIVRLYEAAKNAVTPV